MNTAVNNICGVGTKKASSPFRFYQLGADLDEGNHYIK